MRHTRVALREIPFSDRKALEGAADLVSEYSWGKSYPLRPIDEISLAEYRVGAFEGEEMIGFGTVGRSFSPDGADNGELWIAHDVVHPAFRGQGIFSKIYDSQISWSKSQRGRILSCTDNPVVAKFFLRNGWVKLRDTTDEAGGGAEVFEYARTEKHARSDMNIHFFEEYPTRENMAKLDMVDWPATILVAAPSLAEFESIREAHGHAYPHITFGWWPTVPDSYWVSGLADPSALDRLFAEMTSKKHDEALPVLMDLELPLKKSLWIRNMFNVRKNKGKIHSFLRDAPEFNLKIYTAEYPASGNLLLGLWKFLGISPALSFQHTKLIMCYSSMGVKSLGARIWSRVQRFEKQFALANAGKVGFGLGTIAVGVLGNEPILSAEGLEADLRWAKASGVKDVFVFRLGGLNESYISAIKRATL